jgi:hypothetical protein
MPTLLETQCAISHALIHGEYDAAASLIVGDMLSPAERLDVYRNNFVSSLTTALRISYPAVHRLVGEAFFESVAQCFIGDHPPQTAYLNAYGAEFPNFLAQFPQAQPLTYLADVARLEWAVNIALHADDAAPIDATSLTGLAHIPPERLILVPHPSITLLRLDHPAKSIWDAVLSEDDTALNAIDPGLCTEWLMVERTGGGIEVTSLSETECCFAAPLFEGQTFKSAVNAALDADVSMLFAEYLTAGRFIDFHVADNSNLLETHA